MSGAEGSDNYAHQSIDLGDRYFTGDQFIDAIGFAMGRATTYNLTEDGAAMGEATVLVVEVMSKDGAVGAVNLVMPNDAVEHLHGLCELRLSKIGSVATIDLTDGGESS